MSIGSGVQKCGELMQESSLAPSTSASGLAKNLFEESVRPNLLQGKLSKGTIDKI